MFLHDPYPSELGKPPKWLRGAIGPVLAVGAAFIPGVGPFLAPVILAADQGLQEQETKKTLKKQERRALAAPEAQTRLQPTGPAKESSAKELNALLPLAAVAALLFFGS